VPGRRRDRRAWVPFRGEAVGSHTGDGPPMPLLPWVPLLRAIAQGRKGQRAAGQAGSRRAPGCHARPVLGLRWPGPRAEMAETRAPYVVVCGSGQATSEEVAWAEEVGRLIADAGAVLVCGGLGGGMDAAARGGEGG